MTVTLVEEPDESQGSVDRTYLPHRCSCGTVMELFDCRDLRPPVHQGSLTHVHVCPKRMWAPEYSLFNECAAGGR